MPGSSAQMDQETAQALEVLMRDPEATQTALAILREELQSARGPDRAALLATISLLEGSELRPG